MYEMDRNLYRQEMAKKKQKPSQKIKPYYRLKSYFSDTTREKEILKRVLPSR